MPPVVPAVEERSKQKIDDNIKISDNAGSSSRGIFMPRIGNEALQEEEEDILDQGGFVDTSVLDEIDSEIENEQNSEEGPEIEDEQSRNEAVGKAADMVQNAVTRVNQKIETLDMTGKRDEANTVRSAATELGRIQSSMNEVRGWNFAVVPQAEQKQGFLSKFWNRATGIFSKVGKLAVNIATSPVAIYKYVSSNNALARAREKMQEAKNYDNIPGWNGAVFNRSANESAEDILSDERRVPTVWSYLTAGRAEINRDGQKEPAPPEVTIYVEQPTTGSANSMKGTEMGHVSLGISYTRYSNITKRNERYALQYGFYPAGGFSDWGGTGAQMTMDAIVPGQLRSDKGHAYSISKRYPATMAQVGRILKDSEHYAEGGYSYYKRNCTTFVRDMTVNSGQILESSDDVFRESEVRFSPIANAGKVGFGAIETYSNARVKNHLARIAGQSDMSYQGFGNKRVTRQDADRYMRSVDNAAFTKTTLIPAELGENLRRNKGGQGTVSSYEYTGSTDIKVDTATNLGAISEALKKDAEILTIALDSILTDEDRANLPSEMKELVGNMSVIGSYYLDLAIGNIQDRFSEQKKEGEANAFELLTDSEILDARANVSDELDKLSDLYYTYLKGDSRINTQVMNTLSQLQRAVNLLDNIYREKVGSSFFSAGGDLGNVANRMFTRNITLRTRIIGKEKVITITPSLFEAYMQTYNYDIERATGDLIRKAELSAIPENERSADQKKELAGINRYSELALEFEASHRYMLERKTYTQQDIDYAMNLAYKEQSFEESEPAYSSGSSAGAIYQQLIFERIFGGISIVMNQISTQDKKTEGLSLEVVNELEAGTDKGTEGAIRWFDGYFIKSILAHPDITTMVMNSIYSQLSVQYGPEVLPADLKEFAIREFWKMLVMYVYATVSAHKNEEFFGFIAGKLDNIMNGYALVQGNRFFDELGNFYNPG